MPITVSGTSITFNDATTQTTAFTGGGGQLQFSLALRGSATNSSGTPLVFNSTGSCTWTCPTGVTKIKLIVIGGGGGGGGGSNASDGTRGGGGGVGIGFYTVTPGTAYAVTIGAGASGGGGLGTGGNGGSSSFGSLLTATGGVGGVREYGQRSNGSASLGTIINNNTEFFSASVLGRAPSGQIPNGANFYPNPYRGGSQSAQTYTITYNYSAGAGGYGGSNGGCIDNSGGGSVSGAVYIEYVGS